MDPQIRLDPARGVHVLHVDNPHQLAAEARATEVVARAQLNQALLEIDALEEEIRGMVIASRFKPDKKAGRHGVSSPDNINRSKLNEPDYKRSQLLNDLARLRREILSAVGRLADLVMDIEASKTEG